MINLCSLLPVVVFSVSPYIFAWCCDCLVCRRYVVLQGPIARGGNAVGGNKKIALLESTERDIILKLWPKILAPLHIKARHSIENRKSIVVECRLFMCKGANIFGHDCIMATHFRYERYGSPITYLLPSPDHSVLTDKHSGVLNLTNKNNDVQKSGTGMNNS